MERCAVTAVTGTRLGHGKSRVRQSRWLPLDPPDTHAGQEPPKAATGAATGPVPRATQSAFQIGKPGRSKYHFG